MNLKIWLHHNVAMALGVKRVLTEKEIQQRKNMRRSVVSTTHLPVGHILTHNDVTLKRPGTELNQKKWIV